MKRNEVNVIARVLLIIGGGIAAYKCLDVIRRLRDHGIATRVILTEAGKQFVTPLSLASLSGETVFTDLFDLTDETEIGHIELSRSADLILVAPASADLIAKMAHGLAGDLATTALLASDKPVIIAPAMNVRMWLHRATQRNLATLKADGVGVIGPEEGDMACGEYGPGRMSAPDDIVAGVLDHFGVNTKALAGRKVLVSAGPTHEPIDPVRYIANRSSGRQGYAIAAAAARAGASTIVVSGPVNIAPPPGVEVICVETAAQMHQVCLDQLPADIAIFTAAVADWRVTAPSDGKIKKTPGEMPRLAFTENPDILRAIAHLGRKSRPALVVGFAAETGDVIVNGAKKLQAKGCDFIVANDVSAHTGHMGGDENTVHLIGHGHEESWPRMTKAEVGARLIDTLALKLQGMAT